MSLTTFLQQCLTDISLDRAYAFIAISYTLVYDILHLVNFVHGDIFMMARYLMIFTMASLPWSITIPVTLITTVLLSVTIKRMAYRPLCSAPKMSIMISAIGVSYLLQNLVTYLPTTLSGGYPKIPFLKKIYWIGGPFTSFVTLLALILTLVLVYLLILLINHTRISMTMRAVSKDYKTASPMGIKINRTIISTFAVRPLLAGIGSILYSTDRMTIFPSSGAPPGLKCLVAAVFGGTGSIPGAVVRGFILGLRETVLVTTGQFVFSDAFMFILLIVMLLIRPAGLFGEKMTDKM